MMSANGLSKLMEECGELVQICAKKLAYYHTDIHPDGKGSMKNRMMEEMGDVLAAVYFTANKFEIPDEAIFERADKKLQLFKSWDESVDNITDSYDVGNSNLQSALDTVKLEQENLQHISKINADLRKELADAKMLILELKRNLNE